MESLLEKTATLPAPPVETVNRRYQVAVENLQQHMFVAELDRPWLDTPFLLQGFMIDSKVEIDTLVKYCDYVYVDLELSSPTLADTIRRADMRRTPGSEPEPLPFSEAAQAMQAFMANSDLEEVTIGEDPAASGPDEDQAAAPRPPAKSEEPAPARIGSAIDTAPRTYVPRPKARVSQNTRKRFRQLVQPPAKGEAGSSTFAERWLGWLFNLFGKETKIRASGSQTDLLPSGMQAVQYEERRSMIEELPRARKAFSSGESALAEVMGNIRSGKVPALESVAGAVDSMVESMLDNPDALMWIARLREEDINTYNHGVQVALHLVALGRHLGLPKKELGYLGQIGMLADIGKTRLPRALLDKPGMLSPEEFERVKEHVGFTLEALAKCQKLPDEVVTGIAQHHERVDGSGYPKGLRDKEIGLYGRMTAIADSFAALITPRVYANAWAPQDALMNLYEWSGTSFHEPMVEQFVQAIGVFPVGSMIELTSGEIGVVVAHNRTRRLEPKVLILSNPDKSPLAQPVERDLLAEGKLKGTKMLRITRGLPAGAFGFKLRDYYLDEIAKQEGIID